MMEKGECLWCDKLGSHGRRKIKLSELEKKDIYLVGLWSMITFLSLDLDSNLTNKIVKPDPIGQIQTVKAI